MSTASDHPTLPFLTTVEAATAGKDVGMAHAAEAASDWVAAAYDAVATYAQHHEFFHADEFWTWGLDHGLEVPEQPKALGPVIARAARDGVLDRTNAAAPSVRSHLSLKPVWRCANYPGPYTGQFRGRWIDQDMRVAS